MLCPQCDQDSQIRRTFASHNTTMRERECLSCGYRWQTIEMPFDQIQYVVAQDPSCYIPDK